MTVTETPAAHDERHVLRVVLAHAVDMFGTPTVELGSTVGGFTPGIDQCIADLEGHPEEKGLRLEVARHQDLPGRRAGSRLLRGNAVAAGGVAGSDRPHAGSHEALRQRSAAACVRSASGCR